MVFSGSRGPFLAFLVLSMVFFFINAKSRKWRGLVFFSLVAVALFFKSIIRWINETLNSIGIASFNRIYQTVFAQGDVSSGRDSYYLGAIQDFLKHPIFGKAYLLDNGSYVHNIFIEQFRAVGIVGGILFLVVTLYAICMGYNAFKARKDVLIIYLLFLQYVVYGCFSSSIIAIPQYWIGLFVVLNYIKQNKQLSFRTRQLKRQRHKRISPIGGGAQGGGEPPQVERCPVTQSDFEIGACKPAL